MSRARGGEGSAGSGDVGVDDDHGNRAGPRVRFPTGATLARGLAVGRWLNWAWIALIVLIADTRRASSIRADDPSGPATAFRQPVVAWACVVAALALCVWGTVLVRRRVEGGLTRTFAVADGAVALVLGVLDGWVFDPGHVFATSQSLAAQSPFVAAASIGLVFGRSAGAVFGLAVGPTELVGAVLNDFDDIELRHVFSIVASSLFFAAAGAVFGWLGSLLRRVETTLADRQARDEVADVLHDTVLQTLAVVEVRTRDSDPELARSARRADRDLRRFLFGATASDGDDLETRIRHAVERTSLDHDVDVVVNVVDVGTTVSVDRQRALAGAVGEAVANALKHAHASRIIVFVETGDDGAITASVRDDGVGFDVDAVGGRGLDRSIHRRLDAAGGRAEVDSRPGRGTDVRLWIR